MNLWIWTRTVSAFSRNCGKICRSPRQKLKRGEITIPKYRALYLDTRLKEQDDLQVEKNREFRMLIRNMKTAEENDFELPDNLQAQLREYQKQDSGG